MSKEEGEELEKGRSNVGLSHGMAARPFRKISRQFRAKIAPVLSSTSQAETLSQPTTNYFDQSFTAFCRKVSRFGNPDYVLAYFCTAL